MNMGMDVFKEIAENVVNDKNIESFNYDINDITAEAFETLSYEVEDITDTYESDINMAFAMNTIQDTFTTESHINNVMDVMFKANGLTGVSFADMTIETKPYIGIGEASGNDKTNDKESKDKEPKGEDREESKLKVFIDKVIRGFLNIADKVILTIKKWFAKISLMLVKSLDDRKELLKKIKEYDINKINEIESKGGLSGSIINFLQKTYLPFSKATLNLNNHGLPSVPVGVVRAIMSMTSGFIMETLPDTRITSKQLTKIISDDSGLLKDPGTFGVFSPGMLIEVVPGNSYVKGDSKMPLKAGTVYTDVNKVKALANGETLGVLGGIQMKTMEHYLTLDKKSIENELKNVTKFIEDSKKAVKEGIKEYEKDKTKAQVNTVRLTALSNRRNALSFKSVSSKIGFMNDAVKMAKFIIKNMES